MSSQYLNAVAFSMRIMNSDWLGVVISPLHHWHVGIPQLPSPSVSCWQRLVVLEDSVVIFRFIFVPFFLFFFYYI
jgi:hypothetical protein